MDLLGIMSSDDGSSSGAPRFMWYRSMCAVGKNEAFSIRSVQENSAPIKSAFDPTSELQMFGECSRLIYLGLRIQVTDFAAPLFAVPGKAAGKH